MICGQSVYPDLRPTYEYLKRTSLPAADAREGSFGASTKQHREFLCAEKGNPFIILVLA